MANHDMKKTLRHLYNPSAKAISIVDVHEMNYLMIDGTGNPSSERYQKAVESLYALANGIRAVSRKEGFVFTVMPLEGLWAFEGEEKENFKLSEANKDSFQWTLMILQPAHVIDEDFEEACETVRRKKSPDLLDEVRFDAYHEGESVQIMHVGSSDDEGVKVKQLHDYIKQNEWQIGKRHHEIYLNDPRKVAPSQMKTIIRQPFNRE